MNAGLRGHQFVKEGAEEVLAFGIPTLCKIAVSFPSIQGSRDFVHAGIGLNVRFILRGGELL